MTAKKQQTTASKVASVVSIPGYEIRDLLGRGGMAMVYLAVQKSIGREVALKVLAPDHTDDSFSERFLREARIASQLAHPNIITIYDAGIHNDIHYMSMEYIKGKSFNEARDLLDRKQKIAVIKQIAQALDFASRKGFIHRDIKPENILLHQDGRAILTDFGIAKNNDVSKGLTETGKILGTPYFMSPEQTKGLKIDHRTDIYSLGVVLFQALAGYVPYDGPSLVAICIKHLSDPIPQLPRGLEAFQPIINICLSKKPEHRYQQAAELFDALNKISDKELNSIEAKAKQFNQAGQDYNAATMIESGAGNRQANQKNEQQPEKQSHITPSVNKIIPTRNYISPKNQTNISDTEEFRDLKRSRKRMFILLVILVITAGYYKKTELTLIWKQQGEPLAKFYLPVEIKKHIFTDKPKAENIPAIKNPEKIILTDHEIETRKTAKLKESINRIPSNAILLAERYNQILAKDPGNSETINAITELQKWYFTHITSLITKKDFSSASTSMTSLENLYPDISVTDKYVLLKDQLRMARINEPHLQKSRVYFAVNALNLPRGANALEELKIVLNNDPLNQEALIGLRKIAGHFKDKSREQIKTKKYFKALDSTNAGLQAIHNDNELLSLQKEIKVAINSSNDIKEILLQAEKQIANGYATAPAGTSAYDLYQKVITTDKNNTAAKNGLLMIQKGLTKNAELFINQNKFQEANEAVATASRLFPNSKEIQLLKTRLKQEMDAVLPIVPKIKISNSEFSEINQTTLQKIKIGQLLYIGFEYNNFTQEQTIIKVNVYNGLIKNSANEKLIIQKSITISGNKGSYYFTIQLPKTGIINGNYSIELMFGNARLMKANLFGLH